MQAHPQRGSATLELTLIAPALLALALVVGVASSIAGARGDVDDAAWEAARAASLARSPADAQAAAEHAVSDRLNGRRWRCLDRTVSLDIARFVPGGAAAVTLTCKVRPTGGLPLVPGTVTVQGRSAEPLEQYRGMR